MSMSKEEFTRQFMADQAQRKQPGGKAAMFKWTPELTTDLYRLYEQKLSAEEIAERLGVDVEKVKVKLRNDKYRAKQNEEKRRRLIAPKQEVKKSVDEVYIEHLEGEFAKCKVELNHALELNRQLAEEVKELREDCRRYVEEIDVERDGAFQDLFFEAQCLVDCIRGINTDEMKEAASTHILFDLLDSKLDGIYRQMPRVKREDPETAGTAPESKG